MLFTRDKRRELSARAARFLEDDEAEWVQSYWIRDLSIPDPAANGYIRSDTSMGNIRAWLARKGFGRLERNKQCRLGVCAEGALLLALVEDPEVPDSILAQELLREFRDDAATASVNMGIYDDVDEFEGIPALNDDRVGEDGEVDVVKLLRLMGEV